ncbi:hypothetical protein BDF20DRAFT_896859 [Mycotypha africana]|uniref:uncharacterized protein n=1 Tax=Mycotypha africana TaxID=64632 RepID=UPI0022FFC8CC|nr:uncharacterized protein BDF20DRAFT_896859 [Mycotypha africana]KAI8968522.1 hypothetical protein BDF20DRAFT_896859 [Mycotypha africana]
MPIIPPKIPKPYATIKDYKIPNSLRQALELPSYLFTGELQTWLKMPELLDAYFKASLVIAKNGHALLAAVSTFLKKIRENEEVIKAVQNHCGCLETYLSNKSVKNQIMAVYALKEVEWREKRSENTLDSETRIAAGNKVIAKRIKVGEGSSRKDPNKKQKIDKILFIQVC